ncbi:MAG: ATP-binding cassette domain-containing protein, partial [Prevotella sp.]|nr:ATP-binding cassette domain-containing protein [Prevotella sp.]
MSRHSVVVDHIAKSYGRVKAVGNLSLDVGRGELFGIIGPDGAGKTTLFRILATLMLPDSGRATVGGLDVVADYRAVRGIIG